MSIVKKVNNEVKVVAQNNIIDHSQLSGTKGYGCHPISAIRNLPEKLHILKTTQDQIISRVDILEQKIDFLLVYLCFYALNIFLYLKMKKLLFF